MQKIGSTKVIKRVLAVMYLFSLLIISISPNITSAGMGSNPIRSHFCWHTPRLV